MEMDQPRYIWLSKTPAEAELDPQNRKPYRKRSSACCLVQAQTSKTVMQGVRQYASAPRVIGFGLLSKAVPPNFHGVIAPTRKGYRARRYSWLFTPNRVHRSRRLWTAFPRARRNAQ